jgi:hypothetical protein
MKANESGKGCARETFCVAWQFIDWQKVRGKIRSLLRCIVKAIKEGNHNIARALLWLLTSMAGCVLTRLHEGLSRMR